MITPDSLTRSLREEFGAAIHADAASSPNRLFLDVEPGRLREVAERLAGFGARYQVGTAWDAIAREGNLGFVHTFAFDAAGLIVAVRTAVPASAPVLDSITPVLPGAGWSEREAFDLVGLVFRGHPKPRRLVLADDWPAGVHPLRKEIPHNLMPPAAEDVAYRLDEAPEGTSIVPFGPFHASLHEPAHFAVYVDGETIKGCDYRGFMTHRGIEKLCQTQLGYGDVPFVAERICGICGSVHSVAYAAAVESAAGLRIARRAEYIRTIMLEIERLHSHLLWVGVAGHLIGFDTLFMQAWRIREHVMWLAERLTGNRKTYGMVVVGGVRRDIPSALRPEIEGVLAKIETEVRAVRKAVLHDTAIHRRTKGVGRISREAAVRWNLVGPVARARGVDLDVRRDHPYAAYADLEFDVPVQDGGDVWATLLVRVLEVFESVRIIRQALAKMPDDGPLQVEAGEAIPAGRHAVTTVEAPRGECVHYLITGEENRPERWRVRAPTYANLQAVPEMLLQNQLADVPIIVGSIDPCISCTDRVIVVERGKRRPRTLGRAELEALARRRGGEA